MDEPEVTPPAAADPGDIDTPVIDVPEERGRPEPARVDPMVLVPGMVPVFNPLPMPFDLPYNGIVYRIRAKGIDLASVEAADMAVGPDNGGGKLTRFGLRRLYGPEARFDTAAKNRGITTEELAAQFNEKAIAEAIEVGKAAEEEVLS